LFKGVAELPLHGGRVPAWMLNYMRRLMEAIVASIVELAGPNRVVELLSDPFGFQALNNAIGMDWDSSGSTTVTIGVLKHVVNSRPDLGLYVAGGKGRLATRVPEELEQAERRGILGSWDPSELVNASRFAAKTDNVMLQDGYSLYHHAIIVSLEGAWSIVQQGMNAARRMARRYHWLGRRGERLSSLEPHVAVVCERREERIDLDLTSRLSIEARRIIPEIVVSTPPSRLIADIRRAHRAAAAGAVAPLTRWLSGSGGEGAGPVRVYTPQLSPPRGIERMIRVIREEAPSSIDELVMIRGVGPSVLRSLALVAELVYGVVVSHEDPAFSITEPFRYAYIVGGKDGVPYPFSREHAEKVIEFLDSVIREARIDASRREKALKRLHSLAQLLRRPAQLELS